MKNLIVAILGGLSVQTALAQGAPFSSTLRTVPSPLNLSSAVAASNGFDYLAAWIASRQTERGVPGGSDVYATRITSDGQLDGAVAKAIDRAGPVVIPETRPHALSATAGRDGYMIAWASDEGLVTAITDAFGTVARKTVIPTLSQISATRAAWNGTSYLVVALCSPLSPNFAALIDANGNVVAPMLPLRDVQRLAITADDNGFLIVTSTITPHINGSTSDIHGQRLSSSGVIGDRFLIRSVIDVVSGLAVCFDGARDNVVWGDGLGAWLIAVDTHSNSPGLLRQLLSAQVTDIGDVVSTAGSLWIAYSTLASNSGVVPLSADGTIGAPIALTDHAALALATNGKSLLAVRVTPANKVAGCFVTSAGATADFVVAKGRTNQQHGALATDANSILAVWDESVPPDVLVFASRMALDNSFTNEVQLTTVGWNTNPSISFNGSTYLVVWTRYDTEPHVVGRRLAADGSLLDENDIVLGRGSDARVTTDGSDWLVVWHAPTSVTATECGVPAPPPFIPSVLVAARVAASGVVVDPVPVVIVPPQPFDQGPFDLAWNGSQWIFVWSEQCTAYDGLPANSSIRGAAVAPDLSRVQTIALTAQPVEPVHGRIVDAPKVTATSDQILIAWTAATRAPATNPFLPGTVATTAIEYRTFGKDFPSSPPRRRAVGSGEPAELFHASLLAVAHDGSGQCFILGVANISNAPAYQGAYRWNISKTGEPTNTGYRFFFDPKEPVWYFGTPVFARNAWWITKRMFVPEAGSYRLFAKSSF